MTASRLFARAVTAYLRQHLPGWRLANAAPQVVAQQDGERMRIVFGFHIVRDENRQSDGPARETWRGGVGG